LKHSSERLRFLSRTDVTKNVQTAHAPPDQGNDSYTCE
jgi:hypothetical protein